MDQFPQHLGTYQNKDVFIYNTRFGFAIRWGKMFYANKEYDIISMSLSKAIEFIEDIERQKIIIGYYKDIPYRKQRTRFGWVLKYNNLIELIPKEYDVNNLSEEDAHKLIQARLDRESK